MPTPVVPCPAHTPTQLHTLGSGPPRLHTHGSATLPSTWFHTGHGSLPPYICHTPYGPYWLVPTLLTSSSCTLASYAPIPHGSFWLFPTHTPSWFPTHTRIYTMGSLVPFVGCHTVHLLLFLIHTYTHSPVHVFPPTVPSPHTHCVLHAHIADYHLHFPFTFICILVLFHFIHTTAYHTPSGYPSFPSFPTGSFSSLGFPYHLVWFLDP